MVLQAIFLLPVTMLITGMLMAIYYLPAYFVRDEHALVWHLKMVTITLGVLMILSPILQITPIYTWHLPMFGVPYVCLSKLLFYLGIGGVVLGVLVLVTCEIIYVVNSVVRFFQGIFRWFYQWKDQTK